jgi:hypothetical protein
MRQPLAQVSFVDTGFGGKLRRRHRPSGMQDLLEPQGVADPHQSYTCGAAEVGQHLSNALMQLGFVDRSSFSSLMNCRATGPTGPPVTAQLKM